MADNEKTDVEGPAPSDIRPISLIDEMKRSYLDYAMSVIVSRALPDVRDGLKPVHRRILYSMHENGYDFEQDAQKSSQASSATPWVTTTRTATTPSTTRWCAWRRTSPCACR